MDRLKGKNAPVTGASSGIGQAIAVRFAREGANVAIPWCRPALSCYPISDMSPYA